MYQPCRADQLRLPCSAPSAEESPETAPSSGAAGALAVAVLRLADAFVDLLALRAHRVLLGIPARDPHLPAQGDHGAAVEGRLRDLVLADVVGETVVVTVVGELFALLQLTVQQDRKSTRLNSSHVAI